MVEDKYKNQVLINDQKEEKLVTDERGLYYDIYNLILSMENIFCSG